MSMPGFWELIALAFLALLIFGPDRLPGLIRNVGKTVGTMRREARVAINEIKSSGDFDEVRGAAREFRQETASLREEGRNASEELRRTAADRPAAPPPSPIEPHTNGPAPFDPDAP